MRLLAAWLVAALATTAAAQVPAIPSATSRVDRPAMWVADRVTFTVEIACPRGFDVLAGDLAAEKLKLTDLNVLESEVARHEEGEETRYLARYVLTTYRADDPAPSIAPFPVRYYVTRPGQRADEASPAGSIVVPGAAVAFRSLLPDDRPASEVRDDAALPPRWAPYRFMGLAGAALILVSLAPVTFVAVAMVRRAREQRRHARPSMRQVRHAARLAFDDIRRLEPATTDARRDAFGRLEGVVRHHVSELCGVPTAGLTPDEIEEVLRRCAVPPPLELVTTVLATCERSRYAPPAAQPADADWRAAVEQTAQLLGAGR